MADWVRSPSQRWFVNNHWIKYAFEATRKASAQWNSFYGQKNLRLTSPGVNGENPLYNYRGGAQCDICDLFTAQSGCTSGNGGLGELLCHYGRTMSCGCDSDSDNAECWCSYGEGCWGTDANGDDNPPPENLPCNGGGDVPWPCDLPCFTPGNGDCAAVCTGGGCDTECQDDGPDSPLSWCVGLYGGMVPCESNEAVCNPCNGGCDGYIACPCGGDLGDPVGGCTIQPPGSSCPAICCVPGEPGCECCCPDGKAGEDCDCGIWVPGGLCGDGLCCPPDTNFPFSCEFCQSCELCNIYPDAPQCIENGICCQCPGSGVFIDCNVPCPEPPECVDLSSNCYSCGDKNIPIWFECEEYDPCPNPFNPDCTIGDEIVCYEYNTNDPIYYNASNTGATVIKEYVNPVAGGSYSYGNVATICDIPDEFQLCVYGVTSGGVATKLTYNEEFNGTGDTWKLNSSTANVILNSAGSYSGYTTLRIARCTDDSKMFLTFSEGAKLSADDLNKTMHQLLFLIQEKEFASNTYYQLENAVGLGSNITWNFESASKVAATATISVVDASTLVDGETFVIIDSAGTSHTFTIEDSDNLTASNLVGIQAAKAASNETDAAIQIAAAINSGTCSATITATASGTGVTIEQDVLGFNGNRTNTEGVTGITISDFVGGVDYIASDFSNKTFTLISYDSDTVLTSKTYRFDSTDGGTATGGLLNGAVVIQLFGLTSWSLLLSQMEAAISNTTNGHGARFITKQFTKTVTNDSLSVTQSVVGPGGNGTVTHTASLDAFMLTDLWAFVNGALYDTSKPMITFDPPVGLPVNFDLSNTGINDVLSWNGNDGFNTRTPSSIGSNIQIDNLNGIILTSTSADDFLYFDGSNWINKDFSTEVKNVTEVRGFNSIEAYDAVANGALDDYFYAPCDAELDTLWAAAGVCVTNLEHNTIPNAITSFGLGYYAAERQLYTQSTTALSVLDNFVTDKITASLDGGGTIKASFRWELGLSEGREINGVAKYPRAYFDVLDFDVLDHPVDAGNGGIGDNGVLDGTGATAPSSLATDVGYFRDWGDTCQLCANKIYLNNIDKFKFSGLKSTSFGLEGHTVVGTTGQSKPTTDRYLKRIRSALNKTNWGTVLGYSADRHPLKNYPNTSDSTDNSYTDFVDSDEFIFGNYLYNSLDTTASTIWGSTQNLPTVVTYYLAQMWDGTGTAPSFIQWDGSIDEFGNINHMTDAAGGAGNGTTVPVYLNTASNRHYYWRWLIMGENTGGSGTNEQVYSDLSYYSPYEPAKTSLGTSFSVLPATGAANTGYSVENENLQMAIGGAYSIKFDANKVFSNMERVLPDMYDEYVFEVQLDADARSNVSSLCPDGLCYEIETKIEKFIDGCFGTDTDCTRIGATGGTNNNGYHVYPTDFNAGVLAAWDTYPYDKLRIEIRNKTTSSFDLVVHAPRLKRIGIIDTYMDAVDDAGSLDAFTWRQLALDFLGDYDSADWDEVDTTETTPNGPTATNNAVPALQASVVKSPAAFSLETAIQFIRLGLPSNIRIAFQIRTTPQTNLFQG